MKFSGGRRTKCLLENTDAADLKLTNPKSKIKTNSVAEFWSICCHHIKWLGLPHCAKTVSTINDQSISRNRIEPSFNVYPINRGKKIMNKYYCCQLSKAIFLSDGPNWNSLIMKNNEFKSNWISATKTYAWMKMFVRILRMIFNWAWLPFSNNPLISYTKGLEAIIFSPTPFNCCSGHSTYVENIEYCYIDLSQKWNASTFYTFIGPNKRKENFVKQWNHFSANHEKMKMKIWFEFCRWDWTKTRLD